MVLDFENARLRSQGHLEAAYFSAVTCGIDNPCPNPCEDQLINYTNTITQLTEIETTIKTLEEEWAVLETTRTELVEVCPEFDTME